MGQFVVIIKLKSVRELNSIAVLILKLILQTHVHAHYLAEFLESWPYSQPLLDLIGHQVDLAEWPWKL